MVGGRDGPGARHVLHHNAGTARDVACKMARNQAAPEIVTIAGRRADDQADLLALVEIFDWLSRYARRHGNDRQQQDTSEKHACSHPQTIWRATAPRLSEASALRRQAP